MSRLTFRLKATPPHRVDMSPLVPHRLEGLPPDSVAAVVLTCGNRRIATGDLFDIRYGDPQDIVIEGEGERLDRIGRSMASGRITVAGQAGAYVGQDMAGGEILVAGDAGIHAATGLRAGTLRIRGNAGDFLAAALPGEHRGMQGGTVVVEGDAGDRLGDRMRRGVVLVQGNAGNYCACRMGAGTVAVLGRLGYGAGFSMFRGSLIAGELGGGLLPTFNDAGKQESGFLRLLAKSWARHGERWSAIAARTAEVRRYVGDRANNGKGEILIWR